MAEKKIEIDGYKHLFYTNCRLNVDSVRESESFYKLMDERRSVSTFSERVVDHKVIENIIKTASTAPSGAHKQPWIFCVVSNQELNEKNQRSGRKRSQMPIIRKVIEFSSFIQ